MKDLVFPELQLASLTASNEKSMETLEYLNVVRQSTSCQEALKDLVRRVFPGVGTLAEVGVILDRTRYIWGLIGTNLLIQRENSAEYFEVKDFAPEGMISGMKDLCIVRTSTGIFVFLDHTLLAE